jgi:hypothetical protein
VKERLANNNNNKGRRDLQVTSNRSEPAGLGFVRWALSPVVLVVLVAAATAVVEVVGAMRCASWWGLWVLCVVRRGGGCGHCVLCIVVGVVGTVCHVLWCALVSALAFGVLGGDNVVVVIMPVIGQVGIG